MSRDNFNIYWIRNNESVELYQNCSQSISNIQCYDVSQLQDIQSLSIPDFSLIIFQGEVKDLSYLLNFTQTKQSRLILIKKKVLLDNWLHPQSSEILYILKETDCEINLKSLVEKSMRLMSEHIENMELLLEIKAQNSELEQLHGGLEKIVEERTEDAVLSKKLWDDKVSHIRRLVTFIKDLGAVHNVEELLVLIKKETKPYHNIYRPVLFFNDSENKMVYFQKQQIYETKITKLWPQHIRLRVDDREDQTFLANLFQRPVGRTISFPLVLTQVNIDLAIIPVLYFEHDLSKNEIEPFIYFLSERLQPLITSLERIILEKELKSTSLMWENTFDSLKDPISIIDIDFTLLRHNSKFTFNKNSDAALEKCYQVFNDINDICLDCPLKEGFSHDAHKSKVKRGDKVFEVHSYPIKFKNEAVPTTYVNHYLDITLSEELHSRLLQNEKMTAVGHLAGNIAHELNNPLSGIKSMAQLLLSEVDKKGTLHSDLVEVEKAAERCHSIIKNLQDFSSEKASEQLQVISLREVVEKTLPLLKTAMRDFNIEIDFSSSSDLVKVEIPLLQQVIFNLINNACQAMREGGKLRVTTEVTGQHVMLKVQDSGPGMSEEVMKNIFEPFYTTKKEGQGTGLGLSISYRIIKKLGGDIRVKSQLGQGAEFCVKLPHAK